MHKKYHDDTLVIGGRMPDKNKAALETRLGISTYNLLMLQSLIKRGKYRFTASALDTIRDELDIFEDEAKEIVLKLTDMNIYKTMPSEKIENMMQDVYLYNDKKLGKLYIKLQKSFDKKTIIISFKHDTSWR